MILLRHDCLVFKTPEGDFPLAAEQVTMDVIGDAIELLDEETIKHASEAVLHYFKVELGQTAVTVGEFTKMLERALNALGFTVQPAQLPIISASPPARTARVVESDLAHLVSESEASMELALFSNLRAAMQNLLDQSPDVVRFRGLRPCVKQMLRARRWSHGCQQLNDQIVEYLRTCFDCERRSSACGLVIC